MEKFFIGIDLSFSGTGVVILDSDGKIFKQFLFETKHDEEDIYDIEKRMIEIKDKISNVLEDDYDKIVVAYIENISFGSQGRGADQLAALNYFIRIFLYEKQINFYMIAPTSLKKYVTGKGQCKKNLMLKEVYKRWGEDFDDDNIADSYSLARMAVDDFNRNDGDWVTLKVVKKKKKGKKIKK